jgi:hypothetical protein
MAELTTNISRDDLSHIITPLFFENLHKNKRYATSYFNKGYKINVRLLFTQKRSIKQFFRMVFRPGK